MAELKTKPTGASVDDYVNSIADDQVRKDCKTIAAILQEATKAKGEMWGPSIAGFGRYAYRYSNGKTLEWIKVGFSARKQNIVIYVMTGLQSHGDLLAQLGKHSSSKGSCLYIKRLSDIKLPVLKKLVKASVAKVNKIDKENRANDGKAR